VQIHSAVPELLQGSRTGGQTDITKLIGAVIATALYERAKIKTASTCEIRDKYNEIYLKLLMFPQTQLDYKTSDHN
jgi:hypothetical protein